MTLRATTAAALTLTGLLVFTGCAAGSGGTMPGMDHSAPTATPTATGATAADAMFASMMIAHHRQAVEMSDSVLAKDGVDPRVAALAQRIKAAQSPEIAQLQGWLDDWGVAAGSGTGMDHGSGMMTEEDLARLEAATGAEASRLFLEQMIVHHEGAIAMAETQIADGDNAEAVALAREIVAAQGEEITEMRELLAAL